MEFNKLIKTKLFPILQKFGFDVAEEFKNIVRFQSSVMKMNVVFNDYEKSNFIEIGRQNELLHSLNDNDIRIIFNSELHIEHVTPEIFVQNLSTLFETNEGIALLKGNIDDFIRFKISEDNHYTSELLLKQGLESSEKAWKARDYAAFVESINRIGISKIPKSYQLKYKIAKQKL